MADTKPGFMGRAIQAVRYTITGAGPEAWFGPFNPLTPQAPAEVKGRQFDYLSGRNLNYRPRSEEPLSFSRLRHLAEYGIVRIVMDHQKNLVEAFEWNIVPKETTPGERAAASKFKGEITAIEEFLAYPDKVHDWAQWLRGLLEEMFVIDAVSIYRAPTAGGGLYALEILAGETIFPLLDASGRQPIAPNPAYQQVLKGIPAADFSTEELIYTPKNWRANRVYGQSPVQMIAEWAQAAINRASSQSAYFTHGNLPDGFFTLPADFTNDQIKQWQSFWDDAYANIEARRHGMFTPNGTTWNSVKPEPLKDDFDEWLARIVCFAFSTSPQPFIKAMSRGNQAAQQEVAESGGILTYLAFVKRLMNRVIKEDFGCPDLEFSWKLEEELDLQVAEQMDDLALRNGSKTQDEVRERRGQDPYPDGMGSKPMIYTATGPVLLEEAIKPPEPTPAPLLGKPGDPAQPGADTGQQDDPPAPVAKRAPLKKPEPVPIDSPAMRKASKAMQPKVKAVLASVGAAVAAEAHRELLKLGKAADDSNMTAEQIAAAMSLDGFDVLPSDVMSLLQDIASTSGQSVLVQLDLTGSDLVNQVDRRTLAYARSRAAEMVGKVWDGDVLVDNPNAEWAISDSTREMLRQTIADGLEQNLSSEDISKAIRESYAFSEDRAALITHTEVARANTQGALEGAREARDQGIGLKKLWLLGQNPCDECLDNEGDGAIDLDEDFSSGDDAPPAHPNCLPGDALVLSRHRITGATKRWYDGDLIVIRTASGKELACTPNHPVLTDGGFIPARFVDVGGHVVSTRLPEGEAISDDHHQDVPAPIHEIAEAFGRASHVTARPVKVAPPDFHGDGEGSEVAIVWSDGLLRDRDDASRGEHSEHGALVLVETAGPLHAERLPALLLEGNLASPDGLVGGGSAGAMVLRWPGAVGEALGGALVAAVNPCINEPDADGGSGQAEALGNRQLRLSSQVGGDDLLDRSLLSWARAVGIDPRAAEGGADGVHTDAPSLGERVHWQALGMFLDEVVYVGRRKLAAHVYNLETAGGWYVANGIVTHNCYCSISWDVE